MDTEGQSETRDHRPTRASRNPHGIRKPITARLALMVGIVTVIALTAGAFYLRSIYKADQFSDEEFAAKITWRMGVFTLKAKGGIPELSWSELWQMIERPGGFGLRRLSFGKGVNASVVNSYVTIADNVAAARNFKLRCVTCHGNEGGGGATAPALNHSGLIHGDSDLAIYKDIRDGIPNTAMHPPAMSMVERWQLVGYVRRLQIRNAGSDGSAVGGEQPNIAVSSEQILAAGSKTDEWLTYSGSLDGHRYTPLDQITPANVSQLRIRWVRQFDAKSPEIEATPLVVGGMIFTTEPVSETFAVDALDAKSGDLIWRYTRPVSAVKACCGGVNRGLAILGNHLYAATLDGYLISLNANTGVMTWQTQVADASKGFSMTSAPLIANRSVVVGIAGAEYATRGFVAAYDPETGKKQWQFDTIPAPSTTGHETWSGDSWQFGGGSTWITGSYDPALDLLYWGVGNPAPAFSGDGRAGDNLYTDSVLALHVKTGKLAWYFQFTPHDQHDWDSAQTPTLADIPIDGTNRKVILWANRNGFYYVLDRVSGKFIAGMPFVEQTWAKGLNAAGRPITTAANNVTVAGQLTRPSGIGGTTFQNTAFDQKKELVFVPATEAASVYTKTLDIHPEAGEVFGGSAASYNASSVTPFVRALDAATGEKKWEYASPALVVTNTIYYGGLLATGGDLVFGASGGSVFALESRTGREMWRVFLGGDTRAPPISFTVDGKQVVAVSAGRSLFLFGL